MSSLWTLSKARLAGGTESPSAPFLLPAQPKSSHSGSSGPASESERHQPTSPYYRYGRGKSPHDCWESRHHFPQTLCSWGRGVGRQGMWKKERETPSEVTSQAHLEAASSREGTDVTLEMANAILRCLPSPLYGLVGPRCQWLRKATLPTRPALATPTPPKKQTRVCNGRVRPTIGRHCGADRSPRGREKRAQHLQRELSISCCLPASWDRQEADGHLGNQGLS